MVDGISFNVGQGEIFALIGPNGAGKTTIIRMMMDIIRPDSGEIFILGERLNEIAKNRIGYLPEERGLYWKLRVVDSLIYLASGWPVLQLSSLPFALALPMPVLVLSIGTSLINVSTPSPHVI